MYFCGNLSEKEGGDQTRTKEEINTARRRGGREEGREGWREKRRVDGRARAINRSIDYRARVGGRGGRKRESDRDSKQSGE